MTQTQPHQCRACADNPHSQLHPNQPGLLPETQRMTADVTGLMAIRNFTNIADIGYIRFYKVTYGPIDMPLI